jgi:hypothetical protein
MRLASGEDNEVLTTNQNAFANRFSSRTFARNPSSSHLDGQQDLPNGRRRSIMIPSFDDVDKIHHVFHSSLRTIFIDHHTKINQHEVFRYYRFCSDQLR